MTGTAGGAALVAPPTSTTFYIHRPCWLIAHGTADHLTVIRSVLVRDSDSIYRPVARHIEDYGLVMVSRGRVRDENLMHHAAEVTVWGQP